MIDFIILIIILLGVWRGFMAGAVRTAVSLVAWFFALIVGSSLAVPLAPLFASFANSQIVQIAWAFLAVALAILIFGQIVAYVLVKTLKLLRLGFLDKLLGAALGATKGLVKVLIILSVMSPVLALLPSFQNAPLTQSLLPLAPVAKQLAIDMASELKDVVDEHEQ